MQETWVWSLVRELDTTQQLKDSAYHSEDGRSQVQPHKYFKKKKKVMGRELTGWQLSSTMAGLPERVYMPWQAQNFHESKN